jgi:alkylhydroperoxidase/carboxymuconolactone decarboxylase family protein YurZ
MNTLINAWKRLSKHVSAAKDMQATKEELLEAACSMLYFPKEYNENSG